MYFLLFFSYYHVYISKIGYLINVFIYKYYSASPPELISNTIYAIAFAKIQRIRAGFIPAIIFNKKKSCKSSRIIREFMCKIIHFPVQDCSVVKNLLNFRKNLILLTNSLLLLGMILMIRKK